MSIGKQVEGQGLELGVGKHGSFVHNEKYSTCAQHHNKPLTEEGRITLQVICEVTMTKRSAPQMQITPQRFRGSLNFPTTLLRFCLLLVVKPRGLQPTYPYACYIFEAIVDSKIFHTD